MPERITVPFIALILLMATHGAVGYQQATAVVYASVLLALGLAAWFLIRTSFRVHTTQVAVVGSIVGLMLLPMVMGLSTLGSKAGVTFLVCNLVAFSLFSQVERRYDDQAPSIIARSFLVAGVVSAGLAAYLLLHPVTIGGLNFGREAYFRPVGTFSTPNRFGEVAAVGVLASLYLSLREPSRRLRYGLAGTVLALATVASGSKGVMLGLLGAVPFFLLFTRLVRTPAFWRAGLALLPIAAVATFEIWDYLVGAAKLDLIQEGSVELGSGRGAIWAAGVNLFESAPVAKQVFGHGATFFVNAVGNDPHSMYLHLLVDYGMVSVLWIPFLLLYGALLAIHQVSLPIHRVLALSLIAFCLVRGVSMPTIFTSFNFAMLAFWAGLALLLVPGRPAARAHA